MCKFTKFELFFAQSPVIVINTKSQGDYLDQVINILKFSYL